MKKKRKWPKILGLFLLALICIGVVELMVCRVADPALYEKITAPARAWWGDVRQSVNTLATQLLPPPREEEPAIEDQAVSEPELVAELPIADPDITRLEEREDGLWLTGGVVDVRYYCQIDPQWSSLPYGSDNIGAYGCGPTAMSMAVSSLTDQRVDPAQMADWAYQNGYWAKGSGSRLSLIQGAAEAYGLTVRPMTDATVDDLLTELGTNHMAVALMTTGHFTKRGHFILLRGTTLEGKVLVADPASPDRSMTPWDPQLILDELSASRHSGAPLWLLTS